MASLDSRSVEEAGFVADQRAAGKDELRQRLQPARCDGARAVGDTLATGEEVANRRMGLEALEFFVRREVGIGVAQAYDEANGDLVVVLVIEE